MAREEIITRADAGANPSLTTLAHFTCDSRYTANVAYLGAMFLSFVYFTPGHAPSFGTWKRSVFAAVNEHKVLLYPCAANGVHAA